MQRASPTIRTVARRAGVSIATVSYVINGSRACGEDVRERVLRAIREVGYRPNSHARALRRRESRSLGLIVPDNANPFFAEIAHGIEAECRRRGYTLLLGNSDGDPAREAEHVEALVSHRVDGLILISSTSHPAYLEALIQTGPPLVIVDRALDGLAVDTVVVDNRAAGRAAVEHLISLGHRRIVCVSGPAGLRPSAERVAGYREALAAAGLAAAPVEVIETDFTFEGGRQTFARLAALVPRPTAVFACNDLIALGILNAALAAGWSVPGDLSIVGFDDILPAALVRPSLTTMAQPGRELGRVAADRLLDRLSGIAAGEVRRATLQARLVVRESTAPPREAA